MQDADRANILRREFHAQLHDLNPDAPDGAAYLERHEAEVLVRYHEARDAALALKASVDADEYYDSPERIVYDARREELRAVRFAVRTARGSLPNVGQAVLATMHDFSEPSDEELLAADGGAS